MTTPETRFLAKSRLDAVVIAGAVIALLACVAGPWELGRSARRAQHREACEAMRSWTQGLSDGMRSMAASLRGLEQEDRRLAATWGPWAPAFPCRIQPPTASCSRSMPASPPATNGLPSRKSSSQWRPISMRQTSMAWSRRDARGMAFDPCARRPDPVSSTAIRQRLASAVQSTRDRISGRVWPGLMRRAKRPCR